MASASNFQYRIFFIASLVTLSLFWCDALRAQEKVSLPDYVIKEFGKPPAVPEGPLSKELQSAVTVAFIDSMEQSSWQEDQTTALGELVGALSEQIGLSRGGAFRNLRRCATLSVISTARPR